MILFTSFLHAQNSMKAPQSEFNKKSSQNVIQNNSTIYDFYKRFVSPIDGDRCMMHPSCSAYAKNAISKYGVFIGFLFITDRLTRCGNDLFFYRSIILNRREYFLDPVYRKEYNDE